MFSSSQATSNQLSSLEQMRDKFRNSIRTKRNKETNEELRRQMIKKMEAQYITIPKSTKIDQLYNFSTKKNILGSQLSTIMPSIKEFWKKGKQQNYFLLIFANILCDDLGDEDLHQISQTVRELIQPDFSSIDFARSFSFFFRMLFKWHKNMATYDQDSDQILNQQCFLPIVKVMLENSNDQYIQMNLVKGISHMFKSGESPVDNHYKIKRNIKIIQMIINYHLELLKNSNTAREQLCLHIYRLTTEAYMESCIFMNNHKIVTIFESYSNNNKRTELMIMMKILSGIYNNQGQYNIIDPFINKFLEFILREQPFLWVLLVKNITENSPSLLIPHLQLLFSRIVQILKQDQNVEVIESILDILRQLIYCQRDRMSGMQFYKIFDREGGFKVLDQMKIPNLTEAIEQILQYESICLIGEEMDNPPYL